MDQNRQWASADTQVNVAMVVCKLEGVWGQGEVGRASNNRETRIQIIETVLRLHVNIHLIFWGAAMNLMTYSKVNQPTNTASAISKKSSSSEKRFCYLFSDILVGVEMENIVTNWCLRSMPLSSFCWNWGRVEKMRQRVETTTNMQDTTATTWSRVEGEVIQAGNGPSPWQRRSRGDSQTGSRGASAPPSSSGPQTPRPDHHPEHRNIKYWNCVYWGQSWRTLQKMLCLISKWFLE